MQAAAGTRATKPAVIILLSFCFLCLAGALFAGYCYECPVCYKYLGGMQSIGPFSSREECNSAKLNTVSEMGLGPGSVTDCRPCGGGGEEQSSYGSPDLNELVAKVLVSDQFTAEEKFMAASAPIMQSMLQGAIQGLFSDDAESREQRRLARLRAEQERAEQERIENERFAKVKAMLKQLSRANDVELKPIGGQGNLMMKKVGGADGGSGAAMPKKLSFDEPAPKPDKKDAGGAAAEQLQAALYFSQKAAAADSDEEAKAYADAAFGEAAGKAPEIDMPPEADDIKVTKKQAEEFEDLRDAFKDSRTRLQMIADNNERLRVLVQVADRTREAAYKNEQDAKQKLNATPASDKAGREAAKKELEKAAKVKKEAQDNYNKWLKIQINSLEQERMRRIAAANARLNLQNTVNRWATAHVKDIQMHTTPVPAAGIPSGGKRGIGSPPCGAGQAKVLDYGDFYYCCPQDHPYLSRCDERCYTADDFNLMKIPCDSVLRTY